MTSEIRIPARPRARRTQADRTAETRRRVIQAVVESVAEVGFQRTTGTEIARRAGVSWGAIQHHFVDKNGILAATLEDSFQRLASTLGEPDPGVEPIEDRVSTFVDRAWEHFGSPNYRSTFEILLNLPEETEPWWAAGVLETWQEIWSLYFPESPVSTRETVELMHFAVSTLSGLATTAMLGPQGKPYTGRGLSWLKGTLIRELDAMATGAASR